MTLKIVIVSGFYSTGMGYTENCLPKFLAKQGHDVHLLTSEYNVYGNQADYGETYEAFLGPARASEGTFNVDGYTVHRMPTRLVQGYIWLSSLSKTIRSLNPDIVHSIEHGSIQTYKLALLKPFHKFKLFTESHQHLSVVKHYLLEPKFNPRKVSYALTRTWPGALAAHAVECCYAISPDCAEVAEQFFGVPATKIRRQSLGSDTDLFRPAASSEELTQRKAIRNKLIVSDSQLLCVYTGRFSEQKNPLILAQAIDSLSKSGRSVKGVFVGSGAQAAAISGLENCMILPFMKHAELADLYRAADIAIWPREESMSMLDAASSGLPLVVSDSMGEPERIKGNGLSYKENDQPSMADAIVKLQDNDLRTTMGKVGRERMCDMFSWSLVTARINDDYMAALRA
jgi:glycosyltransferase involved in cell wall biosynthesis